MSNRELSLADKQIIEKNYDKVNAETLAVITSSDVATVESYIEHYRKILENNNVYSTDSFNFVIVLTNDGNIKFKMNWSDTEAVKQTTSKVGILFHKLCNGDLKKNIIYYLLRYGEAYSCEKTIKDIIDSWVTEQNKERDTPIVPPHEVIAPLNASKVDGDNGE